MAFKAMEAEVNVHFEELFRGVSPDLLLTHQIRRLQVLNMRSLMHANPQRRTVLSFV